MPLGGAAGGPEGTTTAISGAGVGGSGRWVAPRTPPVGDGFALGEAVAVGLAVGVAVGAGVTVGLGVAVTVGLGVAVGAAVGVGVGGATTT